MTGAGAAGAAAGAVAITGARDLAGTLAIRQGQFTSAFNQEHGLILSLALKGLAVQADGDLLLNHNGLVDRNLALQIIGACRQKPTAAIR